MGLVLRKSGSRGRNGPAIPPQMARVATLRSWVSMLLDGRLVFGYGGGNGGAYSILSVHVVPVTAAGFTVVLARILRISRVAGFTDTAEAVAEMARRRARRDVGLYIFDFLIGYLATWNSC